ncbi:MAG TPA: hypothetical protein VK154_09655 [Chitinophagales bacterium]|nr:hypothetical protein [Chitinophagales bacterium]
MSPLDAKKTLKNLKSKGFVLAKHKSDDHIWIEFWHKGKLTRVKTKISHSSKELNDYLIKCMSNQTYLSKSEFVDLATCPLSHEAYIAILKTKKIIE